MVQVIIYILQMLDKLPATVKSVIFRYLDLQSLLNVSETSTSLHYDVHNIASAWSVFDVTNFQPTKKLLLLKIQSHPGA